MTVAASGSPDAKALREIAEQIAWAAAPSTGAAAQALHELAEDLRTGGRRASGMDLLSAFSPALLLPDQPVRESRALTLVTLLRDLSVFAPIAVTWYFLGQAVKAWNAADTGEPFLQFWQSDPSVTPISQSATYIVLAMGLIGVLTIAIGVLERRVVTNGATALQRQQLGAALARATLLLSAPVDPNQVSGRELTRMGGQMHVSSEQLAAALERTGQRLTAVLDSGREEKLARALERWTESAQSLSQLSESLAAPAEVIEESVKLRQTIEVEQGRMRVALTELVTQLEKAAKESIRESAAHSAVADGVRESTSQLGLSLDTFTQRTEFLEAVIYQMQSLLSLLQADDRFNGQAAPYVDLRDNAPQRPLADQGPWNPGAQP
jgi:hypothetical protein